MTFHAANLQGILILMLILKEQSSNINFVTKPGIPKHSVVGGGKQ